MRTSPLVSIVVATYNRSRVLAHAVESVRRSTLSDWELLVVGDHCTDDTADVVASFGDPRITFVNLASNVGEQSGPNNEGLRLARGRYVAYLNHDDMFFPDHLALATAWLERTAADLVWSPLLVALPVPEADLAAGRWRFCLSGVPIGDDYDPRIFVFASAWLLTRELAARVGPWRPARETFVTSSQDWLFRAWRSGARMRVMPGASVLAVPAGARRGSYATPGSPEHDCFAGEMRENPRFREIALGLAAVSGERESNRYRFGRSVARALRGLAFRPVSAAAIAMGVHPYAPFFFLRHGYRGNIVSAHRQHSGLNALGPK
jgi:glycosyltransferase involved in cell wall biosynthesis